MNSVSPFGSGRTRCLPGRLVLTSGPFSQPGWPLRAALACVTIPHSTDPSDLYGPDEIAAGQEKDGTFLWLATGDLPDRENPYAPGWAWRGSRR